MQKNNILAKINKKEWNLIYDHKSEQDSCGIGFVAQLDAVPRHSVVSDGVRILINLEHRGAIGGDKSTGDGAGILVRIPDAFFRKELSMQGIHLPSSGDYAVGTVFLPKESLSIDKCKSAFENIAGGEGCETIGWRDVPVSAEHLGMLSRSTMPVIKQIFLAKGTHKKSEFERKLFVIRRLVEKEILSWNDESSEYFYIPSLSSRKIVYKGMLTGTQLKTFFPDLNDESFASPYALVHQRYSTNTLPSWKLAQPFRFLGHNGEINTLRGNVLRIRAREKMMRSEKLGDDLEKVKPIILEGGSDSAIFDNVLELLVMAGRSLPHAIMMMVPEAWGTKFHMSEDKRAFYEYHSAIMEPWDGPAALVFTDDRYIGGTLDRNGLRPSRYTITKDGMIVMASETGVLDIPGDRILRRGRLQPGKMFLVDLEQHRVVQDNEIKAKISRQKPYRRWVKENRIELRGLFTPAPLPKENTDELRIKQRVFGYTEEELKMIISPMASKGQEPVGSMGNDAALAVLSDRPQLLFSYFKQLFAQVTNPPIDPLREELVMSVMNFIGRVKNILDETPEHFRQLRLQHPILTPLDMARLRNSENPDIVAREIDITFPADGDGKLLAESLTTIFWKARKLIAEGATILILTDKNVDADHAPIPVLLATAGLHHHLIEKGLRSATGIIVETGEPREVMHFALLSGYGASAICPYLVFSTIREMADENLLDGMKTPENAMDSYITAVKKGLLKTFSRMGISTIRSYFQAQIFEAVGLNKDVIDRYFCGTPSRIGGIGLDEIAKEAVLRHRSAYPKFTRPSRILDAGGAYHVRKGGEKHLWSPEAIYKLQLATRTGDYNVFKEFTKLIDDQSQEHCTLRSLFKFKKCNPVSIDDVEPVEKILPRFVTSAMSFGSISREAHEAIAIAVNRIGAHSNSGEGGEDPERNKPLSNGDSKRSSIKQVASGRFGVTIEYLINADELQIKMAQGAKPGEGGQLPGHKVSKEIASVRHTTPGVTLISPPPHHDIYSIEDLSQLIYDLRTANPNARISVKLVSEIGVGTVAAGVAKAKADMVLISGYDGGTGASPLTSIKHVGVPWELGLAETQQSLVFNRLRDRIRVQVDGQLRTGRDIAIAALMGAEEFGFGTSVLVSLGCVMMRKCHLNTCPVGVATQNPELRKRFSGKPEYVINLLKFTAQELREQMAELGFRTVDEMIGRVDMLETQQAIEHWKAKGLDFTGILASPLLDESYPKRCIRKRENEDNGRLDDRIIEIAMRAIEKKEPVEIGMAINNVNRTVGARLSGEIAKRYGLEGLPDDTIRVFFKGSAGQSFGAFLSRGVTFRVEGDANDYFCKGISGGKVIIVPPENADFPPHENVIIGNVALYGAISGNVYICGVAGERFAVRNSGANAVVEGVGDHGCEYMTGGTVVVLGQTGNNFGAGMSGGIAYIYDDTQLFDTRCNLDMVDIESVWTNEDKIQLHKMIDEHYRLTNSARAKSILDNWEASLPLFVKVMPMDYRKVLEQMRAREHSDDETVSVTEEVYDG